MDETSLNLGCYLALNFALPFLKPLKSLSDLGQLWAFSDEVFELESLIKVVDLTTLLKDLGLILNVLEVLVDTLLDDSLGGLVLVAVVND